MSVSRRKPTSPPPRRRPRVAGLNKPSGLSRSETAAGESEASGPGNSVAATSAATNPTALPMGDSSSFKPSIDLSEKTGDTESSGEVKSRPNPRSKIRASGATKPAGKTQQPASDSAKLNEAEAGEGESTQRAGASSLFTGPGRRQFLLAGALVVVAGLLIWLALIFKVELNQSQASTGNSALVDVAKTSQVKQDVNSAVETLFSYKYNDTAKTESAAKNLLINDQVRAKYESLFAQVKQHAPEQKLIVTVKAVRSAVVTLDGDRARVLVFVDQTSLRTATGDQAVVGGGQLAVNAELRDGKWKIADLDGYGDTQQPTPSPSSVPASGASTAPPAPPSASAPR